MKKLLLIMILFISWPKPSVANDFFFHVLDVGEGQSILLRKNNRGILIDTGHAGAARQVLKRMQELEVKDLDYLILSHLHPDHASGYFRIHEAFENTRTLDNCYPVSASGSLDMVRWVDEALENDIHRQCVKKDDQIDWQDVQIKFLWPEQRPAIDSSLNHTSLVVLITYKTNAFLVMGDADVAAEAAIMESQIIPKIGVLVAGHHGSKYASSASWIKFVQPEISVISVNKNNIRQYPSEKTLEVLNKYSNQVFVTAAEGEFMIAIE